MDIAIDSDERQVVNKHIDSIVRINPYPINTTEFDLPDNKKKFLLKCGKVGALEYLYEQHKDLRIDKGNLDILSKELEVERQELIESEIT